MFASSLSFLLYFTVLNVYVYICCTKLCVLLIHTLALSIFNYHYFIIHTDLSVKMNKHVYKNKNEIK